VAAPRLSPDTEALLDLIAKTGTYQKLRKAVAVWVSSYRTTKATPPISGWDPNYPLIGGHYMSAAAWSNSANDSKLAPLAQVVFDHYYTTEGDFGRSLNSAMSSIRSTTPTGIGVTPIHSVYIIQESTFADGSSWYTPVLDKLNAENWWMRVTWSGGAGTRVTSWFGGGAHTPNATGWAHNNRKDSSGKSWIDWHAEYAQGINVTGGTQYGRTITPNTNISSFYLDNSFWKQRDNGDYDHDNATDTNTDSDFRASFQAGMVQYAAKMRALHPTFPILGNLDFNFSEGGTLYNSSYTPSYTAIGDLYQLWDGGLAMEHMTGANSFEFQQAANGLVGFYAMRNSMRYFHGAVRDPKKLSYKIGDLTFDNSSADNQRWRFGACAILVMANGMIDDTGAISANSATAAIYTNNGAGHGWLGKPVSDTPNWTPDGAGVYVREFTNGYAAVNPRNNGAQNFTLPVNVRNIVTSTTYTAGANIPIADRDGVLLIKT
jgi:hypothetical protein